MQIHDILVWIRIRIWIRGSMPLTNGSRSGCGSAIFVIDLQDANKSSNLNDFFAHYKKKSQSSRNQGFSYFFCLVIEGSRAGAESIPLANGSGYRRPKNMWIRWIRWIRIRNTAKQEAGQYYLLSLWCNSSWGGAAVLLLPRVRPKSISILRNLYELVSDRG